MWVACFSAVASVLVVVPYLVALLRPPEGYLLARTLYYGNDLSQYLAAMGDGAASTSWLIQDHLTAEAHNPAFMYPFYVFMGKAAGIFGLPPLVVFALASALSVPALVFAAYSFSAAFAQSPKERRAALIFLILASGLGIWAAAVTSAGSTGDSGGTGFSYDRAEVSTYLLPFGPPHLTLALALLLVWGRALAGWSWQRTPRYLGIMAISVLGVGLLNPFTLATMVALSCVHALFRWISTGRFPWTEALAALMVSAVAAPLLAANVSTFALDPFWSLTYGRQNTTGSPPPWTLAVDFGLLLPLAVVGALNRKVWAEQRALLFLWAVSLLALMYLPVPFQRRFGFGLQPALAVLGGLGMAHLSDLLRKRRMLVFGLGLRTALAVGLFSGTMLGYVLLLMAASGIGPLGATVYEPRGNLLAAEWLASHSGEKDVLLVSTETGNYLAGRIRGRVVVGHKAGTVDYDAKEALIERFFNPATGPAERLEVVQETKATLIFLGKRERALGGAPLREEDGFSLLYDANSVQIYRVERQS